VGVGEVHKVRGEYHKGTDYNSHNLLSANAGASQSVGGERLGPLFGPEGRHWPPSREVNLTRVPDDYKKSSTKTKAKSKHGICSSISR